MNSSSVFKLGLLGLVLTAGAPSLASAQAAETVRLSVPYVSQVPQGDWVLPWSQACEEASIAMVQYFYEGKLGPTVAEGKAFMEKQIAWEDANLKKNEDTNADETVRVIEANAGFEASVKRDPTLDDIKDELRAQRPVIALVGMYELYGEKSIGDSFHVLVVNGFDDAKRVFYVEDPARENAKSYSYETMMGALHDFNAESKEGDGPATVLFTDGSDLVRANGSGGFWQRIANFFRQLFL